MNKVFIRLYAFFCSLVIIVTLGFFCVRLFTSSQQNLVEAEKNFKYIARYIAAQSESMAMTEHTFLQEIKSLCELSGNIEKAILANEQHTIVFSWNAYSENDIQVDTKSSFIFKPYSMSISVKNPSSHDTRLYTFSAVLRTLSDALIARYVRDALLVFSLLFICTLIFLIAHYLLSSSSEEHAHDIAKLKVKAIETPSGEPKVESYPIYRKDTETKEYTIDDLPEIPSDFQARTVSGHGYATSDTESTILNNTDAFKSNIDANQVPDFSSETFEDDTEKNVPKQTSAREEYGFSNNQRLEEKLSYELSRATSSEQDISLLIVQMRTDDEEGLNSLTQILREYFTIRDLTFTYKKNSFAIILPDADLEICMHHAETIYNKIVQVLSREDFGIGMSTRSARLVSAVRLIEEADSAVEKAFERFDSPIVAFRPDPQAYREFIKEEYT